MTKKRIEMETNSKKTIDDAFMDFMKFCRVKNLADATLFFYEKSWEKFKEFYNGDLENITSDVIDDYILYLKKNTDCKDISINTHLRGIRAILYYFMEMGHIEEFKISMLKAEKKVKETYTDRELKLLLEKPDVKKCDFSEYRNWVIINFLLATGCRSKTIRNIQVKDLDLENCIVKFAKTKNRKQQIVPISNQLSLILNEYLEYRQPESDENYVFVSVYGEKMNPSNLNLAISRYNNRRGVRKAGIHLFRHTFAKKWIQNGGNIFSLQKMLGHSSLDMVKEYVHLFGEDIRRDYDRFNPLSEFTESGYISMRKKGGRK